MSLSSPFLSFSNDASAPTGPGPPHYRGFTITRHITIGRNPLGEWSARSIDLYPTTHNYSQETDIHASGGIRTRNPKKRMAADTRLRRCGHRVRLSSLIMPKFLLWSRVKQTIGYWPQKMHLKSFSSSVTYLLTAITLSNHFKAKLLPLPYSIFFQVLRRQPVREIGKLVIG
jgi:hypothetical protein